MSKSLKRVRAALAEAGLTDTIRETPLSRTAPEAAAALGVEVDQIAKSVIFADADGQSALLFVTAGGNRVDPSRAEALAGVAPARADAEFVRAMTGFVIGGVSPLGHVTAPRVWFDPRLAEFDTVWAAAGTPRHVFSAPPRDLARICGAEWAEFTL